MTTKQWLQTVTKRVSKLEHSGCNCTDEEPSCINIRKDLVARNHIVASLCAPSRPIMTNEHKQLKSFNMEQFVHGNNQIKVNGNQDGSVSLSLTQELTNNKNPTFDKVTLTTTPVEATDATSKLYVDDLVKKSTPALNMCEQISVVNPNGDCLRIGRTNNNFIDINVEENGTLNLTNEKPDGKINDIDIYGERINLLSNLNTTSPNTGSLVIYGGLGVMKDLQLGGNLYLKTNNGVPTKLNFYEEGALPIVWGGIWDNIIDTSFVYQRIGGCVTLMIPYTAGRATCADNIINTCETYLPERLRPIYDINVKIDVIDNDTIISGYGKIYGDNGKISIIPKKQTTFSGEGISGFHTFSVSYMVDTKKETLVEEVQV